MLLFMAVNMSMIFTFDINTLSFQLSTCWIRLALGHIVYCQYIPTLTKSHLKSLQEMKQKLHYVYWLKMLYITRINNVLRKKV